MSVTADNKYIPSEGQGSHVELPCGDSSTIQDKDGAQ